MSVTAALTRRSVAPAESYPTSSGVIGLVANNHARQMLGNPLIWLATLLSGGLLIMLARDAAGMPELARFSTFVGLGSAPLAAAALLVAHNNVSRPRRDGTEALFHSLAADPAHRTAGQLLGGLAAVAPALLVVIGWAAGLITLGTTGTLDVAELAVGPVVVALASVVGTTVAAWAPQRSAGLAALGLFALVQTVLHDIPLGTVHWLAWWRTATWHTSADLWVRPSGLHLAYLVGLGTSIAVLALARHGLSGPRAVAGVAAAALAAGAGLAQLPYPSQEQVAAVWDRINNPQDYWDCEVTEQVQVCLFPAYSRWRDGLAATARATLGPVPASAQPDIKIVQTDHGFPSQIMDEFPRGHRRYAQMQARGQAIFDSDNVSDGGAITIDTSRWAAEVNDELDVALGVAKRAVGLPLEPVTTHIEVDEATYQDLRRHNGLAQQPGEVAGAVELDGGGAVVPRTQPCRPLGQAREAVALWLAARSSPGRTNSMIAAGQAVSSLSSDSVMLAADGAELPAPPNVGNQLMLDDASIQWTPQGVYLAAQLLTQAEPTPTIPARWAWWTDPSTTTDQLIDEFGLTPYPSAEQLFSEAGLEPSDYPEHVAAWPDRPGDTGFSRPPACS